MYLVAEQNDPAPHDRYNRCRAIPSQAPARRVHGLWSLLFCSLLLFAAPSAGGTEPSAHETLFESQPEFKLVDAASVLPSSVDTGASVPCHDTVEPEVVYCPEHDEWLVSSRGASTCGDPVLGYERLEYWRGDGNCGWIPSTAEEFHATDNPRVPTIFFVHGNRVSRGEAKQVGRQWVRRFEGAEYGAGPARLVIFTWPSDQIAGKPIEDVRVKAHRSEAHAWYLAALIDSIPSDVPIGLVGYSYGARLISASLHLLGGGRISGRQLARDEVPPARPLRAVLLAAALDNHWLGEGQHHGLALSQVDSLVVFVNHEDSLLRLYPRLFGRGGPDALGRTGVVSRSRLGVHGSKLRQINVAGAVGKHHDWHTYVNSGTIMSRARREFAFDELKVASPPDEQDPPPEMPMAASAKLPTLSAAN